MTSPIAHLEPKHLWARFDDIRKIPRPSKHEEKIRAWVLDFAKTHGLETRSDALGNVVVCIPGKPGKENAPVVILQGHLDMVCEKNADKDFDFHTDPIELVLEGDRLRADGTTLGADNGIAIAAGLGLVTDDSVQHGPIELLCTLDEETGLTGARDLDPSILTGKLLINLDSEEDGVITMGCAGGRDTEFDVPLARDGAAAGAALRVTVKGCTGGHSGVEIHLGRANAVKLLADALATVEAARLVSFAGGNAHNAIPREASAVIVAAEGAVRGALDAWLATARDAHAATDPELAVVVEAVDDAGAPMTEEAAARFLGMLRALPHGVLGMSAAFPDLVETSQNVAVVRTDETSAHIQTSTRSSIQTEMDRFVDEGLAIGARFGATAEADPGYPGWAPNPDSALLARAVDVYAGLDGDKPKVEAIHAGLECGLIGEKVDGMDMISIGPTIRNPHSPSEEISVSSTQKMLGTYLNALLEALAE